MISLLFNRAAIISLVFLLVQQLIVASSSVWLTKLVQAAQHDLKVEYLYFYLLSLSLPFLPGVISNYFLKKAELRAKKKYIDVFLEKLLGKVFLWKSEAEKKSKLSWISNDGPELIGTNYAFFSDFVATALNVALNMIVLSVLIDESLSFIYLASLGVAALIVYWSSNKNEVLNSNSQTKKVQSNATLLGLWDKVLLGNKQIYRNFTATFNTKWGELENAQLRGAAFANKISLLVAFVSIAPTLLFLLGLVVNSHGESNQTMSLIVNLPRLFMILNFSYALLQLVFSWSAIRAQNKNLLKEMGGLTTPPISDFNQNIKIKLNDEELTLNQTVLHLQKRNPGRITISGPNGCGKSILLLYLKNKLQDEAVYLPPHADFFEEHSELSTGQKHIKNLDYLLSESSQTLLIDEWDANFDIQNRAKYDLNIRNYSKKLPVVEVRHNA